MSTGIIMNFRFMHIQGGRLYIHRALGVAGLLRALGVVIAALLPERINAIHA